MTLLSITLCCGGCFRHNKKLNGQNPVGLGTQDGEIHIYESMNSIYIGVFQEQHSSVPVEADEGQSEAITAPAISQLEEYHHTVQTAEDTSTDQAAVTDDACPDVAIMTSSNKAYGCDIEKVEDHPYKNVDLLEATTLFYTTSDGTRTYRPSETAAVPIGEGEEKAATSFADDPHIEEDVTNFSEDGTIPEAAISSTPDADQLYIFPEALVSSSPDADPLYIVPEAPISSVDASPEAVTESMNSIYIGVFQEQHSSVPVEADEGQSEAITAPAISQLEEYHHTVQTAEDTSTDQAAVTDDACPDVAIMTSSNKAYGCDIEKVEDHPYKNVDLLEATTLFYTTSDGTRTYRPSETAAVPIGEGEEKAATSFADDPHIEEDVTNFSEDGTIPEAAISSTPDADQLYIFPEALVSSSPDADPLYIVPEAPISSVDASPEAVTETSPEVAINSNLETANNIHLLSSSPEAAVDTDPKAANTATEDMSPIKTSSNPAYGCAIEKVGEDRAYTNVNLFEATTLFYTTSDGRRTYRPLNIL